MKIIKYILLSLAAVATVSSCDFYKIEQPYDPEMESVYYCGFDAWTTQNKKNATTKSIKAGECATAPVRLWCEFTRDYDVNVPVYVVTDLVCGKDYKVVDDNGSVINTQSDGTYLCTWKNAVKGVVNLNVVSLGTTTGTIKVQTCSPTQAATLTNQDVTTTIIVDNSDYQVRCFTENYYITIKLI